MVSHFLTIFKPIITRFMLILNLQESSVYVSVSNSNNALFSCLLLKISCSDSFFTMQESCYSSSYGLVAPSVYLIIVFL